MRWVGQSALLRALEQPFYEEQGPKDASSIPGRQNRAEQFGTYIVLHIPSRAQDPDSRSNLAESTALYIMVVDFAMKDRCHERRLGLMFMIG
jgi:hypothetical protein